MTSIRVLHQLLAEDGQENELIEYVRGVRKETGCLEAEAYRSITDQAKIGMVELWQDQYVYADYWSRVLAKPDNDLVLREAARHGQGDGTTEFYRLQYYLPGGTWTPVEQQGRQQRIYWPGTGPVRIIIQLSPAGVEYAFPAFRSLVAQTLREPGCLEFGWYQSVEFPNHVLLLELWQDQVIYDAHQHLRINSGMQGKGGDEAPREQGSNGFEFYRQQQFAHLYDRWLPTDVTTWSDTVLWAD